MKENNSKKWWQLYLILFAIVTIINIVFTMLRSARSALAVADIGGNAALVPYYELLGTLPAAIFLSWALTVLLRKYELPKVFAFTTLVFLLFFGMYAFFIYPLWRGAAPQLVTQNDLLSRIATYGPTVSFFVIAELWKVALLSILVWTYVNQHMPMYKAKGVYAPLMLGASSGPILAGPLTSRCSKWSSNIFGNFAFDTWHASLATQLIAIVLLGIVLIALFHIMTKMLTQTSNEVNSAARKKMTLTACVKHTIKSPYLFAIATIVLTDYVAYSLVEIVFFDRLKIRYPDPKEYCEMMNYLASTSGIFTAIFSIMIGPWIYKRFPWSVGALITPLAVVVTAVPFFIIVVGQELGWDGASLLDSAVFLGGLFYIFSRSSKYAFLDSAKELAFIPLPKAEQLYGKLAIEGIASRGGRALASVISIALIGSYGSVAASVPATAILFLIASGLWTNATWKVAKNMPQGQQDEGP